MAKLPPPQKVVRTQLSQGTNGDASTINPIPVYIGDSYSVDAFSRLRVSEPFGIYDNKNIVSKNSNQWEEVINGAIIEYTGKAGAGFDVGSEIRGLLPSTFIAVGTVVSDNGSQLVINCNHNDFVVGDTITQVDGVNAGTTATVSSTGTGSDIQFDYNTSSVILTAGPGATDKAIRQTHKYNAYVPGKSQLEINTFILGSPVANVCKRVGYFDDNDGLFLEQNGTTDIAFVRRTSTSGSPVDNRIVRNDPDNPWNIDNFDGTGPSKITIDFTKTQILVIDFQWLGVGRVRFGFDIDGKIYLAHEILNANNLDVVYMRTPTLPVRYEISNTAATSGQNSFREICSSVGSEGGYSLPGLEFSTPITWANERAISVRTPLIAIRLKSEFPTGQQNRRIAKFITAGAFIRTNDTLIEVEHVHGPIDITATWTEIGNGSAVEYSTNITAITGRPSHIIVQEMRQAGGGIGQGSATQVSGEFIDLHSFISQNYDSTNSQVFVLYGTPRTGTADVTSFLNWLEFD